jgi:hypothetical protein
MSPVRTRTSAACGLPLRSFDFDVELNLVAFFQRQVAARSDMDEEILPIVARDETVAAVSIEKFHFAKVTHG